MKIANTIFRIITVIVLLLFYFSGFSQSKYWVVFKDKKGCQFNPYQYFDTKAIERRLSLGLSLNDSTDFPVNDSYVNAIDDLTPVKGISRWLNAVSINANAEEVKIIRRMPFVAEIHMVNTFSEQMAEDFDENLNAYEEELLLRQIESMNGYQFIDNDVTGKGVRIAVFDGGFPGVDKLPVFEHLHKNNQILKTWDFVKNNEFVYDYSKHGTMVLACIAGMTGEQNIGLATGAEFILARTETWTEFFAEEENWLAAAEWADKNGADIISSSLGYTYHRYFTTDMDGKTSYVVKAANLAASKGILVVNAMGNDGGKKWKILCTPADGDSVLAVGGIDPDLMYHIDFSSFGPTVDGRLKPNVSAFGKVVTADKKELTTAFGTSFATPLVSGFAACAWQTNPEMSNMELLEQIQKSGSLYPYYDYAHGYGIPQANYFLEKERDTSEMFQLMERNDSLIVFIPEKSFRKSTNTDDHLYYHLESSQGKLFRYYVIEVYRENALIIDLDKISPGYILRFHYKGETKKYKKTD